MKVTAPGRVVRHELEKDSYRPVFEYMGQDGRRAELRSPLCYQIGSGKYPLGREVTIAYEPAEPAQVEVEGQDAALWRKGFLFAFLAIFVLIGAAIVVLR